MSRPAKPNPSSAIVSKGVAPALRGGETVPPLWTGEFVTVITTQMAFGYASSTFVLLPKFLATELHASPSDIGHVVAVTGLAAVVAIPFVGAAIDRFGRKPLVMLGCVLTAIYAFAWLGVRGLDWRVYMLQVASGVGFMLTFNAAGTIAADQAPKQRLGEAIGIFGASNMVMSAIAPTVAEQLAADIGWHAAFGLAGFVALFALLLAQRIRETAEPNPSAVAVSITDSIGLAAMRGLVRRQLPQSVAMMTCGAAYGAVSTFYQPFVIAQGATHVSTFFIGFTVAAVGVRLLFGSLPDRLGRRRVSIGSFIAFACVVLLMTQLTPARLLVFGFLFGCAHGVFYPALSALSVEQVSSSERGRVMTLVMGSFRCGNVLSAVALGWVAESYGYPIVFVLASLVSCFGIAALWTMPEPDKQVAQLDATLG